MIDQSTHSDDCLWHLFLHGKQNEQIKKEKKTKTPLNTSFSLFQWSEQNEIEPIYQHKHLQLTNFHNTFNSGPSKKTV